MKDPYVEKKDAERKDNIAAALGALIILVLFVIPAFLPVI